MSEMTANERLAQWIREDLDMRSVQVIRAGQQKPFEVLLYDYMRTNRADVAAEGDTIDAAIHAALDAAEVAK